MPCVCWFRVSLLQINQLNQNRVALEAEQVFNNQDMISKFAPMRNIPRAFRLVWNSSPKWTARSIFIALLMSAFPLIGLYAQGHIMDELVALLRSPNAKWDSLKFWVILVAGIGLFGSVLKSILTLVSDRQSQDFTDAMKDPVPARRPLRLKFAARTITAPRPSVDCASTSSGTRPHRAACCATSLPYL